MNNKEYVLIALESLEGWVTADDIVKIISPDFMRGSYYDSKRNAITSKLLDLWKEGKVTRGGKIGSYRLWHKL